MGEKNISLKFSRRLTVFATIIYIFVFKINSEDDLIEMIKKTPWERLKESINKLNNSKINNDFTLFEKEYIDFLNLKEQYNTEIDNSRLEELGNSKTFRKLISDILLHQSIDEDLRLFLIS
mgnify:CR=1 FL=1